MHMKDRDIYVAKLKAKLDEWNAGIDKYEAQVREAQADAKIRYERQLAELKDKRDEAEAKLRALQLASTDAWETLRQGAEAAWHDMAQAFSKAAERFR
jgi:chromosome segregation ATPase